VSFLCPPSLPLAPWKAPYSNVFMFPPLFFRVNSLQQVAMSVLEDERDSALKTASQFRSYLENALGADRTAHLEDRGLLKLLQSNFHRFQERAAQLQVVKKQLAVARQELAATEKQQEHEEAVRAAQHDKKEAPLGRKRQRGHRPRRSWVQQGQGPLRSRMWCMRG
jgi:hypothetical protein